MKTFEAKKFDIPELKGISAKNIEEHLKLYQGYVNNANLITAKIPEYLQMLEKDPFVGYYVGELRRRFSFEFNGMRNHEYYFASFVGGPQEIDKTGALHGAISEEFGSFDTWLERFKSAAGSIRGIGWMMLYWDPASERIVSSWVDEQHIGQLNGCKIILALDMWEHSYVADYQPSGKKQYIEDYFENLNWSIIEDNFANANK